MILEFIFQCFAVTGSIAFGIILTAAGIKTLYWLFERRIRSVKLAKITEFIDDDILVDVTLNNGQIHRSVKYLGFTDLSHVKGLPYSFKDWVVLSSLDGKVFVRPDSIKIIKELAKNNSDA